MADPLVDVDEVEVRLGRALSEAEGARVEAFVDDVSGEIYSLVGDDAFHDSGGGLDVPQVVVAIVCAAVMRRMENPLGLTGETIGDYNWQANNGRGAQSVYLTAAERRTVRRAAGLSSAGYVQLEGDLPLAPGSYDLNTLSWS